MRRSEEREFWGCEAWNTKPGSSPNSRLKATSQLLMGDEKGLVKVHAHADFGACTQTLTGYCSAEERARAAVVAPLDNP